MADRDLPRRVYVDRMAPAELAIRDAILAVEKVGCHAFLTDAVFLLSRAQRKVADYVDGIPAPADLIGS